MSTYLSEQFLKNIDKDKVKVIFELGSRDLSDAVALQKFYNAEVYAFECNPDSLNSCNYTLSYLEENVKTKIHLVEKAVCLEDGPQSFLSFDLSKYDNMGASSLLKIDFSTRDETDPDYNLPNPQKEVKVQGVRLDTFCKNNSISKIDLLCMDLQGYELNAIKSMSSELSKVNYIITEASICSSYIGGTKFDELDKFLSEQGFTYVFSDTYEYNKPDTSKKGFSELNVLYSRL
jgi:FkbM family methyltransferase